MKKIAHNSDFERINFSALKGLPVGTYIDPEEYIDTAVLASLWGYPRSLKGFCKVVGGEAKDEAGGRLINMFSVPNRKGGRTLPEERPADWDAYVEYNRQDVVSMRDNIYRLGKGFPSAEEYEAWITATRINDRGIKIDTALASAAHRQYEANKARDLARVKEITGLDNPNSVQQFKGWLAEQGFKMESIDKAHVAELLERDDLPDEVREAVERKQLAALSAATKYVIAQGSTNSDGRLRGTIKYSNANTGRMCLTGDHEVLTPSGWVRIEDWVGGRIATWNPSGEQIAFSDARAVHFPYSGEMIHIDSTRIHQISTPDHDMPIRERDGSIEKVPVSELEGKRFFHYIRGSRRVTTKVRDDDLRVLLMVQADGTYPADGGIRLAFRKQRKVERCRHLLRKAGLMYAEREDYKTGYTRFSLRAQDCPLWLLMFKDKTFGPWIFDTNPSIFFEELVFWDGSWASSGANSAQYYSTNKTNIDLVQAFAHLSGMYCRVHRKSVDSRNPNWTPLWIANLWFSPGPGTEFRNGSGRNRWSTSEYSGLVHCARTTTGFFLVRREGSVWVTGNSGVTLSPHNLPRDHFTDSEGEHDTEAEQAAIDKLLAGVEVGSEDLKKLVRPLLVGPFTVSDYSAVEARLTAWAAGEDGVLESFRRGEDVYVATAERMGGEKAGFDRQRGKAATLGCGFGGGAGALLNLGGAKIYPKGTPDDVIWEGLTSLVETWRIAHPHIVSWWKQVHTAFDKGGPASRRIPVDVEIVGNDRYVWLPSGRALVYHNCRREYVQPKDRNGKPLPYRRRAWVCDAVVGNGTQRRIVGGPTQVENIIQAIGRDLLTHALVNVERAGFRTVTHVHDEIVTETTGGLTVERLSSLMCDLPDWAEGLPVEAAGYTTQRYRKD